MELNNAIADALVKMEEQKNQMSMLVASEGCKAGTGCGCLVCLSALLLQQCSCV
jgi:hypothetical protein